MTINEARERITSELERRHREYVAANNRARGLPTPVVGEILVVDLVKQVRSKTRIREGIEFDRYCREVKVIDGTEDDASVLRRSGTLAVTVDGAERILEDTTLRVRRMASS